MDYLPPAGCLAHLGRPSGRVALGITSADVAAMTQTVLSGAPVTQIRRGEDLIDVTLRADVLDGVQGRAATSTTWSGLRPIVAMLPPGYRIEIGGAFEETRKSNTALFAVFPPMFVALLGVIALSRMIMRNAVILVDPIDIDIATDGPPLTAVVEATVRRSRPVVPTPAAPC